MSDKPKDPLANLFDAEQTAPIDPAAKKKAVNAALQAFAAADNVQQKNAERHTSEHQQALQAAPETKYAKWEKFFQGFFGRSRPTDNNNGRRTNMTNKQLYWRYGAGVSFACVLMMAVLIGVKPDNYGVDSVPVSVPIQVESDDESQAKAGMPERQIETLAEKKAEQQAYADAAAARRSEQDLASGARTPPRNRVEVGAVQEESVAENPQALQRLAPPTTAKSLQQEARTVHNFAKLSNDAIATPLPPQGRDRFTQVEENPVKRVIDEPVSTFSIDVDTASYSFVRRQLNQGVLPQKDAVRIEEMINYFDYQYPLPESKKQPFSTNVVVSDAPWKSGNKLVHIGIKGYELDRKQMPKSNLVFLLDVSGSMSSPDKLPLVKQSMALLLDQLNPEDTVAIAVYAGAAGTVLEPTAAKQKQKILNAMNQLQAGGSTAGAQGIELAYQLAQGNFDKQAVNRVILATDGDFNVGITNSNELKGFVERKRESGIFLSVLGFGQGNYHDHLMQQLAQNGNGVAAYIDTLSEAQKVLVEEATSSLFPIAKDVKIQVEFNPATVSEYRLIGYETRKLNREDFNNDKVDAGDIGAGHTVTAIYEITPTKSQSGLIDESRYTANKKIVSDSNASEYGFVKLRYKLPAEDTSTLLSQAIPANTDLAKQSETMQREVKFATAVAGFAQLLKGGKYTGSWSYDDAIALALANRGNDEFGYRNEFVQLIRKAKIAK